jgi:hypothetical protein
LVKKALPLSCNNKKYEYEKNFFVYNVLSASASAVLLAFDWQDAKAATTAANIITFFIVKCFKLI